MNAAAALLVGGKVDSMTDGVRLAAEVIDSGAALAKLDSLIAFTSTDLGFSEGLASEGGIRAGSY